MRISPAAFWSWLNKVAHLLPQEMTIGKARIVFNESIKKSEELKKIMNKFNNNHDAVFKDNGDEIEKRLQDMINHNYEEGQK